MGLNELAYQIFSENNENFGMAHYYRQMSSKKNKPTWKEKEEKWLGGRKPSWAPTTYEKVTTPAYSIASKKLAYKISSAAKRVKGKYNIPNRKSEAYLDSMINTPAPELYRKAKAHLRMTSRYGIREKPVDRTPEWVKAQAKKDAKHEKAGKEVELRNRKLAEKNGWTLPENSSNTRASLVPRATPPKRDINKNW